MDSHRVRAMSGTERVEGVVQPCYLTFHSCDQDTVFVVEDLVGQKRDSWWKPFVHDFPSGHGYVKSRLREFKNKVFHAGS
jgi:hypothetical protein